MKAIFISLCKPNPNKYPDSQETSDAFFRNKAILFLLLIYLFANFAQLIFSDSSFSIKIFRFLFSFGLLIQFLLFCRSHILFGQILNALIINLTAFYICSDPADGVYYNLSIAHISPVITFFLTKRIPLVALTSCCQLSIAFVYFKNNLIHEILMADPYQFGNTFVQNWAWLFFGIQVIYLLGLINLSKKTKDLAQAVKTAENALDQQKNFVFSFSHEMRNPMNSLLGNLELVLMAKIDPDIREMINTAKICGVLLLNLINTVLDAGKLGIGKLEVKPVPTRIHDVLQRVWAMSHDLITKKGLKSHLKISKQVPPKLMLDGHRINQVLLNLIGNSVKFTEKGSIAVSISWLETTEITEKSFQPIPYDDESEGVFEKEDNMYAVGRAVNEDLNKSFVLSGSTRDFNLEGVSQPNRETKGILKIIIKDTGCGMSKEEVGKLFKKFSQVGQDNSKKQIGTGLGLYISKELCVNMGGEIRAYSKLSIGSTFIVCIPSSALPIQQHSVSKLSLVDGLIPRLKARRLKTIVADDSPFNVGLMSNFYGKIGAQVLASASNGEIAYNQYLDLVKGGVFPDVITLDIDMPVMNGKEACEKIREYEKEKGLKRSVIILISGNYAEENLGNILGESDGGENLRGKFDCFLKKPLVFEEFCWAVYKYCGC